MVSYLLLKSCFHVVVCFCLVIFQFCFVLFFILKFFFFEKIKKIQKQCVFVYIGTCVPWMAIETKFSKLCISCSLDEHIYVQLSKWVLWLLFVMSKSCLLYLTLVSLFLTGRTKKSWKKGINNHLTTVARQSCMASICFGIAKVWCQWHSCA